MPKLDGSQTHRNLVEAADVESRAHLRCLWLARQADVDGHPEIAALFRAMSDRHIVQGHGHLDFLARLGPDAGLPDDDSDDPDDSIDVVLEATRRRATELYPTLAETARAEGFADIAEWFDALRSAEERQVERVEAHRARSGEVR